MVVMPPEAREWELGPMRAILAHQDFNDMQGTKMRKSAGEIEANAQVRQCYDEVRGMITNKEHRQEAMHLFHEQVIEHLDRPVEELIEALRKLFQPLVQDADPRERPFFAALGVPREVAGVGRPPPQGFLVSGIGESPSGSAPLTGMEVMVECALEGRLLVCLAPSSMKSSVMTLTRASCVTLFSGGHSTSTMVRPSWRMR